jgi:pyruvate/2-oxoacid:ferredoxin oxidoreductase alpha subunit
MFTSLHMGTDNLEAHENALEAKYRRAERREARAEHWLTEDADVVLVGYGIVGRILKAVTAELRGMGLKAGMLRPVTLYPFPTADFQKLATRAQSFVVVEMSNGQLIEDVRLALNGARPVKLLSRVGGNVPSHEEVLKFAMAHAEKEQVAHV